jgi:hypothetical protein
LIGVCSSRTQNHDFVRIEIEAALQRNVRVIPVLVDGAAMPKAIELPESLRDLARRQGTEVSPTRFDADVEKLTRALGSILDERRRRDTAEAEAARQVEEERRAQKVAAAERAAREERERLEAAEAASAEEARQKAEADAARRAEEERRVQEVAEAERVAREERQRRELDEATRAEQARQRAKAAARQAEEDRRARGAAEAQRAARNEVQQADRSRRAWRDVLLTECRNLYCSELHMAPFRSEILETVGKYIELHEKEEDIAVDQNATLSSVVVVFGVLGLYGRKLWCRPVSIFWSDLRLIEPKKIFLAIQLGKDVDIQN